MWIKRGSWEVTKEQLAAADAQEREDGIALISPQLGALHLTETEYDQLVADSLATEKLATGPTLQEWIDSGRHPASYPPEGYYSEDEVATLKKIQSGEVKREGVITGDAPAPAKKKRKAKAK